ncbi:hypothetical protein [Candidatus Albibeggiatoa sp. nov. NOAA]|uniref:hypothetical protein n=1 Tax=Candidatus Albibeggiatoa sp. nov. NOAA TaxID=3162724 RepID=UPI0032F15E36|nr:hypothetical protein [Thiotrichaceae bacterium]
MIYITPELKTEQVRYHQTMIDTPQLRHYWPYILKYPLFDNALLFLLFIFPFFAAFSYTPLLFLLPFPAMFLFSYLTALLAHTTNGYALPPRGDRIIGGLFVQLLPLQKKIPQRSQGSASSLINFFLTYIFISADFSSQSKDKVTKLGQQPINPAAARQVVFIIFSIGLLTWLSYYLNSIVLSIIILLWLALLPACLIQIAIDDSILSGLNIKKLIAFIKKMDYEYAWAIVATIITTTLFYITIFKLFGIFFIIGLLICLYTFIACFHLLGYLIYHRRYRIGFLAENTPEGNIEIAADKLYKQADDIVQQAKVYVTEKGLLKHAFSTLVSRLTFANNELILHGEVSEQLFEWEDKRLALKHAALYLHFLIQQQKYVTAHRILQKSHRLQANFELTDCEDYKPLIDYLVHAKHDFLLTLYLIDCFEQKYPNHESIFALQLSKAALLGEQHQHMEQAKTILRALLTQTQHPLHKDALKLAHTLAKQYSV